MTILGDAINGVSHLISDASRGIQLLLGIHELLLSAPVQRIRFSAEAVTITGQNYQQLASKMRSGQLHFVVSDRNWNGTSWNGPAVDPSIAAQYWDSIDTVQMRPGFTLATVEEQALVLHELTHAVIDDMNLPASRGLHRTENEGIAYIAEMLYRRHMHSVAGHTFHPAQRQVANAIARNIAASASPYTVTQDEIRRLRDTIGHRPVYRHIRGQLQVGDGIGLHH